MGSEEIVKKIGADADAEAEAIISAAEARARETVEAAKERAAREREETEKEAEAKARAISDGRAATARLDSAKILLAEKRRVLDGIYSRALERLKKLSERESLALLERMLSENAEAGDEIEFSREFRYGDAAAELDVVKRLGLKISKRRARIAGGCILHGKTCDKDLSYEALIAADAEENQAKIASRLFVGENK